MSKPQKKGISYFPMDVDFWADKKVKILRARYGSDGISIYLYLLCAIYREGYYIKCDEDMRYIISDDLGIKSETVEQVITYLAVRSMFDEQVYRSAEVLTSHGIQMRWQEAVKARASKTPIKVEDYWLLTKEETSSFLKVAHFDDNSENYPLNSENYPLNSENYTTKKSKVNKSKLPPYNPPEGELGCVKSEKPKNYDKLSFLSHVSGRNTDGIDDRHIDYSFLLEMERYSKRLKGAWSMRNIINSYNDIVAGKWLTEMEKEARDRDWNVERESWYARRRQEAEKKSETFLELVMERDGGKMYRQYRNSERILGKPNITEEERKTAEKEQLTFIGYIRDIGLTMDDLKPKWHCMKCKDTGFDDAGKACDCYERSKHVSR